MLKVKCQDLTRYLQNSTAHSDPEVESKVPGFNKVFSKQHSSQ